MLARTRLLVLAGAFVACAAGTASVEPARADVSIIIGGPDATPAPHHSKPKAKPAAAANDSAPNPYVINVGLEGATPLAGQDVPAAAAPASNYGASSAVVRQAMRFLGVPYVWGGASPSGFDCSGFVQYVFRSVGREVPRTADIQFADGAPVSDPQPGDLVFFQTYDWGASHVGIYLGNGYFINAIRPDVHISNFGSTYFRSRYLGARRFV